MDQQSTRNMGLETGHNFQIFKDIVNSRSHWKWYDTEKKIPESRLKEVMETAQRAPSSFNTQPYKVILVRDNEYKLKLAEGMLGDSNKNLVLTADTSAVFLADLQVVNNLPKIQQLWRTTTAPKDYIDCYIPKGIKVQSLGFSGLKKYIIRFFAWMLLTVVGFFINAFPEYTPEPAWAFRQVGFFADHFLLSATAAGYKAAVMEGVNGPEVLKQLNIPSRYKVFCVIVLGHPNECKTGRRAPSRRFGMKDVYCRNTFGNAF